MEGTFCGPPQPGKENGVSKWNILIVLDCFRHSMLIELFVLWAFCCFLVGERQMPYFATIWTKPFGISNDQPTESTVAYI